MKRVTAIRAVRAMMVVWVMAAPVSCDTVSRSESDSDTATASDSHTDTQTESKGDSQDGQGGDSDTAFIPDYPDTDSNPCNDFEAWRTICASAMTESDCIAATRRLTPLQLCGDDWWHGCNWLSAVETAIDDSDACVFGESTFSCLYASGGEGAYFNMPPCDGENENSGFIRSSGDGKTFLGWSMGYASGPADSGLARCNPLQDTDGICPCLCDPAFPVQALP